MPGIVIVPARRTSRGPTGGNWLFLVLLAAVLVTGQITFRQWKEPLPSVPAAPAGETSWARRTLQAGLPLLAFVAGEEPLAGRLERAVNGLTGVDLRDPRSILGSQLALLEATGEDENIPALVWPGTAPPAEPPPASPPPPPPATAEEPLVGIYNTHNAESYLPSQGQEKLQGQNGGVARVAQVLAEALEEQGIPVVRSATIHDHPDFNRSYLNSEQTARQLLRQNPGLVTLVDVHRDAGLKERETTRVDGQAAARLIIIVGSDARQEFPTWRQNLEFARRVDRRLNELYPGLSKGVRVQDGRYNQHLHPRAILVEVGSSRNSLEEAMFSARLLARALADVVREVRGSQRI